jgi:hypothetical protein
MLNVAIFFINGLTSLCVRGESTDKGHHPLALGLEQQRDE